MRSTARRPRIHGLAAEEDGDGAKMSKRGKGNTLVVVESPAKAKTISGARVHAEHAAGAAHEEAALGDGQRQEQLGLLLVLLDLRRRGRSGSGDVQDAKLYYTRHA